METGRRYGSVSEPWWSEAFLIGGGPSLRGFDFGLLRSRTTAAVNDAVLYLPWATALFSLDVQWIQNRRQEITGFAGEKFLAPPENDEPGLPGVVYLRRARYPGLSNNPTQLCLGGNSGYAALNLAYLKRARVIALLGYDFCIDGGSHHWHEGYRWAPSSGQHHLQEWAREFEVAAKLLQADGVRVINVGLGSRIEAFERMSLPDLVALLRGGSSLTSQSLPNRASQASPQPRSLSLGSP